MVLSIGHILMSLSHAVLLIIDKIHTDALVCRTIYHYLSLHLIMI